MTTLICAGGSGARVLEAVLHLCAAGLGPSELRAFVIDPDGTNGNVDRAKKLVDRYQECHVAFQAPGHPFFRTKLDLMKSAQGLRVWSPVDKTQKFKNVLNYTDLRPIQQDVLHLLLTDDELDMEMNVGFRGHPALGAAALALLPLYKKEDPLWSQFAEAVGAEVKERGARVMIVGSLFGGTGASTIHPLVRYLRSLPEIEINKDKLKIGAVALVPYFGFSAAEAIAAGDQTAAGGAAKSEWFALASRSAAEYYEHLRRQDDWDFDAMYWVGDDSPVRVSYSIGGPQQDNPAHFVDLLAALACLEFWVSPPATKACYFSGPEEASDLPGTNVLTWDDIPIAQLRRDEVRKIIHRFQAVGVAHLGFYGPLLKDRRLHHSPHCVPWYYDRFASGPERLSSEENQGRLDLLSRYFRENYFPWWDHIHSAEQNRIRLLNRTAWLDSNGKPVEMQMNRLGNLLYPDSVSKQGLSAVDRLFDGMERAATEVAGATNPSALYLSILSEAAKVLVESEAAALPA